MNGISAKILGFMTDFLKAWGQALYANSPAWLKPHMRMYASVGKVEITAPVGDRLLGDNALSNGQLRVEISGDQVLAHKFYAPQAVRSEVRRMARLEAARTMPVDIGRLALSYHWEPAGDGEGMTVQVAAVRQSLLDRLVSEADRHGIELLQVVARPENSVSSGFEFAVPSIARRRLVRRVSIAAFAVTAAFIVDLMPTFYVDRLQQEIAQVDQKISIARRKTEKIAGLQTRLKAMQSLAAAVHTERASHQMIELLEQLTRHSPDNVIIEDLRLDGRNVTLRGRSDAPEDWTLALNQAEAFSNVTLRNVRQGEGDQRKQFELRLEAVWPYERAGRP